MDREDLTTSGRVIDKRHFAGWASANKLECFDEASD